MPTVWVVTGPLFRDAAAALVLRKWVEATQTPEEWYAVLHSARRRGIHLVEITGGITFPEGCTRLWWSGRRLLLRHDFARIFMLRSFWKDVVPRFPDLYTAPDLLLRTFRKRRARVRRNRPLDRLRFEVARTYLRTPFDVFVRCERDKVLEAYDNVLGDSTDTRPLTKVKTPRPFDRIPVLPFPVLDHTARAYAEAFFNS